MEQITKTFYRKIMSEKIGPEQCMCAFDHIDVFSSYSSKLCKEDEYCFHFDEECYKDCMDLPSANDNTCKCYDEWCFKEEGVNVDIFCNPDKGCYIPKECPQNFTVFNEPSCSCNRTIIETEFSYCYNNQTLPLPSLECPPYPDLAPAELCLCNQTLICQAELMCNTVKAACEDRPDLCPDLPGLAGSQGCYCLEANAICEQGQACGGPDSSCYDPTSCLHPMFIQGWDEYLATNTTAVELDDTNSVIEGTELFMRCNPKTFREDIMEFNDTFIDSFSIQCSNDGSWSGLGKCTYPLCAELKFDATVRETIWGSKEGSGIVQGSILKLECLDQGSTFKTVNTVLRSFFECDKRKWKVTDKALCPENDGYCKEPIRISCVFNGCSSLPPSFQDPVVYDPLLTSYLKGASLTISCSNKVEPNTKFQAYDNDREYLIIKKIYQQMKQQEDPEFCLHEDCLPVAGITWNEKDGNLGKDCVKTDDGTATCLKPSQLEWSRTSFFLKEGKGSLQKKA